MFMNSLKKPFAYLCIFLTPFLAQAKPEFVTESDIANCKYIANVEGSSGYGKNPRWEPIARTYAERKAEALGATHLVLTSYRARGSFNGEVDAKAYTCP